MNITYIGKIKAIPVNGSGVPWVFPVGFEYDLHTKSKAIPITGRGGP
jgi:hypothetical protein